MDIYFDGRKKLPNRGDTSYLFQTAERGEKSTVTAKSSELKLFSEKDIALADVPETKVEEESSSNTGRTIIFIAINWYRYAYFVCHFLAEVSNVPRNLLHKPNEKGGNVYAWILLCFIS